MLNIFARSVFYEHHDDTDEKYNPPRAQRRRYESIVCEVLSSPPKIDYTGLSSTTAQLTTAQGEEKNQNMDTIRTERSDYNRTLEQ